MPGLRLSYWNPRLLRTVFYQLQQQQQTGLFCDVTLQGDGEAIHVHSCVIAACSPYLANLLMCATEISSFSCSKTSIFHNRRVLRIYGIKSLYLFPLVHYMYTSELEVAPGDVNAVLKAARKLQIPELELLKLEGGRLKRTEPGRKLNRNCLGSKPFTPSVTANSQTKDGDQAVKISGTNTEIKQGSNSQNKMEDYLFKQSDDNPLDIRSSSCSTPEIRQGNLDFLDLLCSSSSAENIPNTSGYMENVPSSCDLLQYTASNHSSQEHSPPCYDMIKIDAKREYLVEDALINQDVISNQNSTTDFARSCELMQCKLKSSVDNVPSHQDLSEQRIDLLDSVQRIGKLTEDVESLKELTEEVQSLEELPEQVQSTQELSENIGELPEDVQNAVELLENMQNSEELQKTSQRDEDSQEKLLNRCRTSHEQSKNIPEIVPGQDRKGFVESIQCGYHTKSKEGVLKSVRLDRKNEEIASFNTELLKRTSSDVNYNNIDTSDSDAFEKHSIFYLRHISDDGLDRPHWHNNVKHLELSEHHPDESELEKDAGSKGSKLQSEKKLLYKNESADKLLTSSEISDPPTSLKREWSGVMTEMPDKGVEYVALKSSTHCESETSGIVDHKGLTSSTICELETNGTVDQKFSTQYEHETNATVDHENLTSGTVYGCKQSGSLHQENIPSGTHCESKAGGTVVYEGLTSSTGYEPKQSGSVDQNESPSSTHCEPEASVLNVSTKSIDESRKRLYNIDDCLEIELEKAKLRKINDELIHLEVMNGVESLGIVGPITEKEQAQQTLNVTTAMSPDIDVGVYSPPIFLQECVWPDLSSDSDVDIDILG